MNTNNIPKELIEQWVNEASDKNPFTKKEANNFLWERGYIDGRRAAYLSSLPTGEVPNEKMEVLKEFCKEYNHFYNYPYKEQGAKIKTFDEWVTEPKISALLQSLFSPAQPTEPILHKFLYGT